MHRQVLITGYAFFFPGNSEKFYGARSAYRFVSHRHFPQASIFFRVTAAHKLLGDYTDEDIYSFAVANNSRKESRVSRVRTRKVFLIKKNCRQLLRVGK